jgi:hypothetical protein
MVADTGEQRTAGQQEAGGPEELCKVGSWSSGSGDVSSADADAAQDEVFERRQSQDSTTGSQASNEGAGSNTDDDDSSGAAVVAPEDVVMLAEPSAVQPTGHEGAAVAEGAGPAANSLYELD